MSLLQFLMADGYNRQPVAHGAAMPTGASQVSIASALAVTASSAYASGNVVGGLITLTGALGARQTGLLQKVVLNAKSAQTASFDLLLFNDNPSGSTFTDKGAVSVAVADFAKLAGVVHITDWTATGTTSVGQATALALSVVGAATALYAVLVTRGTPTFTATTDLSLNTVFIQD